MTHSLRSAHPDADSVIAGRIKSAGGGLDATAQVTGADSMDATFLVSTPGEDGRLQPRNDVAFQRLGGGEGYTVTTPAMRTPELQLDEGSGVVFHGGEPLEDPSWKMQATTTEAGLALRIGLGLGQQGAFVVAADNAASSGYGSELSTDARGDASIVGDVEVRGVVSTAPIPLGLDDPFFRALAAGAYLTGLVHYLRPEPIL